MSTRKYKITKRGYSTTQYTVNIHCSELLQFILLKYNSTNNAEYILLRNEFVEYMTSLPNFMEYNKFLEKYYNVTPRQKNLRETNANYPNAISTTKLGTDVCPSNYQGFLYHFSRPIVSILEPIFYNGDRTYIYIKNIDLFEEITMLSRERFYYTCFNDGEYSMFIKNDNDLDYIEKLLTTHNTPYTVKKTYNDSFAEITNKLQNYLPAKVMLDKSISAAKNDNNDLTFNFTFDADSLESRTQTIEVLKDILKHNGNTGIMSKVTKYTYRIHIRSQLCETLDILTLSGVTIKGAKLVYNPQFDSPIIQEILNL